MSPTSPISSAPSFAREHNLLLAVRGGGHNGPGLGSCDGGICIDLSRLKGIRVDPVARTVRVEPGTPGDVDHAGAAFGLAVPAGIVSTTGIAGLALGGGTGHLTRARPHHRQPSRGRYRSRRRTLRHGKRARARGSLLGAQGWRQLRRSSRASSSAHTR
ncbi:MAG: FAD-binding protein [Alphaproteobacteria bacterium]